MQHKVFHIPCARKIQQSCWCSVPVAGVTSATPGTWNARTASSSASAPSAEQLQAHMSALLHASVQSSTAKQYNNVWNNISSFVVNKLCIPLNLPLQNKTVGLYISYLHLLGLRPSTIQSHLSAISHYHKIRDLNDPTQSSLISKLMSSLHKLSPLSDNRLPVTFEILENIISSLDHVCSSQYDVLLYSAMVSFAYHACLRVGEYCTTGNPDNVLNIDQVTNVSRDGQLCALWIYFKNINIETLSILCMKLINKTGLSALSHYWTNI